MERLQRIEIPLGTDLDVAKIEWAKLDRKSVPKITRLLGDVFNRYERDVIPGKMPRTQKDNLLSLRQLRAAFSDAPIDAITPQIVAQYRDKRSGKVRANREISLLSHIYNMAREWGITDRENPAAGVRKNKERPRDFYAGPEIWNAVYDRAASELRDAMDLAYLTGQRPADVLTMRAADCDDKYLQVAQGKTSKKLRIELRSGEQVNHLGLLIERLLAQRKERGVCNPYLITTQDGRAVTASMLRLRFDDARKTAIRHALVGEDKVLAERIRQFQFRDIRPKAASEIGDLGHASRLLGHTDKRITQTVYRRVGEIVQPTR
ncbi:MULTISPECIES: tyrosine-type recombinase/integrase [Pseudomonas]|jgi:integrase|uniref:Site-specific recombinase, phage integrase family n=2 Tax=Pseudomonas putida TaxID=303 RepID=Q88FU5_PSEPK|nr:MULTISPECIES: tyrosine-type recombinase/integrase [Pseudomonas]AAN69581.1 Site-specific recombinase, phage integrase family [Pseudomonas putida KT2440]KMY31214.1 integrase [Pseudomonas putida]PXZ45839.1 integrase [Pseudomonas sp. SMT-1]QDW57184.1 tyrosine-type recombinase/integrase [Pseudomonas sp. KBS0802]QXZ06615.1 tyrosine-type recombinase/integrase [Pseudomonas putida]